MGMTSKKRAQPRIVKKRKRHDKFTRKKAMPQDLSNPELWNSKKTAKQNFADMGLAMTAKPSLR